MRLLTPNGSTMGTIALTIIALPYLIASAPANSTSPTTSLILAVSPVDLAADECPTPPTEFLPYPPPPGYVAGPGCPPASSGTQPSESNPPAGVYGGSGSGSGSTSQSTNSASSLRDRNAIARLLGPFLSRRKVEKAMALRFAGSAVSVADADEMDWTFDGMVVFGGAVEDHYV